ncbi:MAG: cob(I)yrinic acid a,c-diamide adenosyltransferase [Candidatus Woesebacteria bacterium]|nr:cob(I)yrinic acid a,c-diamide adenosyltransferase [Candidatus Woesebacteria bacterium]
MSIYTKVGDGGKTFLFDGKKISKNSSICEALGSLDEVNSWLGVIGGLKETQKDLMIISSILAGAKINFSSSKTKDLERRIDKLENKLPKLDGFIIPQEKSAKLHFARALIRRAERAVVAVPNLSAIRYPLLIYLNRLSDYIFTLARYSNFKEGKKEEIWKLT